MSIITRGIGSGNLVVNGFAFDFGGEPIDTAPYYFSVLGLIDSSGISLRGKIWG